MNHQDIFTIEEVGSDHIRLHIRPEWWATLTPSQKYHGASLRMPDTMRKDGCQWWVAHLKNIIADPNRVIPDDGGWPERREPWIRQREGKYTQGHYTALKGENGRWTLYHDQDCLSDHRRLPDAQYAARLHYQDVSPD